MTMSRILLVLGLAALLAGCTQWRHYELGLPLAESQMPRPEDGWTLARVMDELGPPQRISAAPHGFVMAWEYWEIDEIKVGVGSFVTGVDLVNIDWGRATAKGQFMLLSFNHDHRLVSANFEAWDRDAGGGQGVQPMFSAVDVVDVGDLLDPMSEHRWGAQSLRRIPVTLNQQNRLDSGQAGIEQRGTTRAVGQHSLE
jgi:hypothetical protein